MAELTQKNTFPGATIHILWYCHVWSHLGERRSRKEIKRGFLFTCLSSRAIHIESTNSLCTDAFIQARRKSVSRRGNVQVIRSDNGTGFAGASAELSKAFSEMNHKKINEFMLEHGGQFIQLKRNPPTASNMGRVWERQIRSARSILVALLKMHGTSLNDESLRTFLAEVEAIVNTRPITSESLSDVHSPVPMCPMQLLIMKSRVVMPPPGEFQKEDIYCRKRWRLVQHLANEFWSKWKK